MSALPHEPSFEFSFELQRASRLGPHRSTHRGAGNVLHDSTSWMTLAEATAHLRQLSQAEPQYHVASLRPHCPLHLRPEGYPSRDSHFYKD